ncbi:hypothetical protein Tco_1008612 [Tanacetum coccineum]
MTTLQFADTHNLVAFLSKLAESEGFEQIVDFLNANPIRYALTISPIIYISRIEQFWATVKEGTDCLPNAAISEELTRMGSTNEVNNANVQVSTANSPISTVGTPNSTTNLSDATVYVFLTNQPNGSQLVHEDLEQIHEDDLEEMDLKWQLALLSIRTRMFFQKSGRKININESDTARYNNYMADDEVLTSMAFMAFSDSEFNKSEFNLENYKRGLAFLEEKLVFYKKNEVIFCKQLAVLKKDISYKDSEISMLKSELEKPKQEKESNQLKIENFDNASKSLDKLIGSQIPDKSRKGLGFVSYNVVPPPPTWLFLSPNLDLSNSGLEEFQQPEFEGYGPKTSKIVNENASNEVMESLEAPMVEKLVSRCEHQ